MLTRELATARLAAHGAIVCLSTSHWLLMRDNIVCCTSSAAVAVLPVGNLPVLVIWIGVLENDVPGVKKAGEKAEAAKCDVDKGICAANPLLDPH